eukprot:TRINITY_DN6698_c0_g1_i1.p1 TRINITY_DN6698_c0_g1~~TRINITY_DN6698_c0_g1_i1.p1  ORF type:complete len:371 (-),score=56.50 TRINITY_DN6698_c0_g1_i1:87-1199(-)
MLSKMKDFYVELKWDFQSGLIPFIQKLAPSDTFKIWKIGKSLRLDYQVVGFKKLRKKLRDMSLIFNPTNLAVHKKNPEFQKYHWKQGKKQYIFSVNRQSKQYTNLIQEIDLEEKKMLLYDLLTSLPCRGQLDIKSCKYQQSSNWLGRQKLYTINNWKAKKYEFKIMFEYKFQKKSALKLQPNYQNYQFGDQLAQRLLIPPEKPTDRSKSNQKKGKKNGFDIRNLSQDNMDHIWNSIEIEETKEVKRKTHNLNIWLTNDFPLSSAQMLPIIKVLGQGNEIMGKINTFLEENEIKNVLLTDGFPAKLQLPFSFALNANIYFNAFKYLDQNEANKKICEIPQDFSYIDRKILQKIQDKPQKRMMLSNFLIVNN